MPCIRYVAREYFDRMRTDEHVDELVTTDSLDRGGGVHPMIIEQGMITALVDVPTTMEREAGQCARSQSKGRCAADTRETHRHCCCQGKAQCRQHGAPKVHVRACAAEAGGEAQGTLRPCDLGHNLRC